MRISFGNFSVNTGNNDYGRYRNSQSINRMRSVASVPGSIIAIIVAVVLIAASFFIRSVSQIDSSWKRVTARVTSVEQSSRNECDDDSDGNQTCRTVTYYRPTLAYTVNGRTITTEGSESESIRVGDNVDIAYEPGNETNIKEVAASKSGSVMGWAFLGFGILMIVISIFNIVKGVKAGKQMISDASNLAKPAEGDGITPTGQVKTELNQTSQQSDGAINNNQFPRSS